MEVFYDLASLLFSKFFNPESIRKIVTIDSGVNIRDGLELEFLPEDDRLIDLNYF